MKSINIKMQTINFTISRLKVKTPSTYYHDMAKTMIDELNEELRGYNNLIVETRWNKQQVQR